MIKNKYINVSKILNIFDYSNYFIKMASCLLVNKLFYLWAFKVFEGKSKHLVNFLSPGSNYNSESIYQSPSFIISSLGNIFVLLPVILMTVFFVRYKKVTEWDSFEENKPLKIFIISTCFFVTWIGSLYEYNYYFGSYHFVDRLIILSTCFLCFRHTCFVPVLALTTLISLGQFSYPLQQSITDKKVAFEFLLLFTSCLVVKPFFKITSRDVFFLTFTLIGANYFIPACSKMNIGPSPLSWVFENEFGLHAIFVFKKGWLETFDPNYIKLIEDYIMSISVPMQVTAITVEVSGLFLLWNRRFTFFLLLGFICFHWAVFIESGIFFWKWIWFNCLLAFLIFRYKNFFNEHIFNKRNLFFGIFIVFFSNFIFAPVALGWWDVRYKTCFRIKATDEDGIEYNFSGNQLYPYEQVMTFTRFYPLVERNVQYVTPQFINHNVLVEMKNLNMQNVNTYIQKNKGSVYSVEYKERFDLLLKRFIKYRNQNLGEKTLFTYTKAPEHIWTAKYLVDDFPEDKKIASIRIYLEQYLYDQGKLNLVHRDCVYTVDSK